jgi:uracil phosphoribosyltransferase
LIQLAQVQNRHPMFVLDHKNSIANQFLAQIRDKEIQNDRMRFRRNLERIGEIMAYEISQTMQYKKMEVVTPLGSKSSQVLVEPPILIAVLRAALPFYQGFLNFFDNADCGFIGAYRKEGHDSHSQIEVDYLYQAAPVLEGREVFIIDPMLATGKSFAKTVNNLFEKEKPGRLHLCSVIAAPEGIEYLNKEVRIPMELWVGSVDERLNDRSFIIPGLGDAGDLSFGEKR